MMNETVLLGRGSELVAIPRQVWQNHLAQVPEHAPARLSFMTEAHHQVRYYLVRELPRQGQPIPPERIAQDLKLLLADVQAILDELEQNLFFLVRNAEGAVAWAFPVTVEPTPHRITMSSGERLYAAWAEDAIATPFVQGRLRAEPLWVTIHTACAHCSEPLQLTVDSALQIQVDSAGAEPLLFEPHVDWATFTEPNILNAYWRNSQFFWSEEHARDYRAQHWGVDGAFLTMAQSAYAAPIAQGALFNFAPDG